jgi:hypothetical protein
MNTNTGRQNRYTFANTERGAELRRLTAESLASQGITSEESQEVLEFSTGSCTLLLLTVTGKRPGEGRIAADMKARKV